MTIGRIIEAARVDVRFPLACVGRHRVGQGSVGAPFGHVVGSVRWGALQRGCLVNPLATGLVLCGSYGQKGDSTLGTSRIFVLSLPS